MRPDFMRDYLSDQGPVNANLVFKKTFNNSNMFSINDIYGGGVDASLDDIELPQTDVPRHSELLRRLRGAESQRRSDVDGLPRQKYMADSPAVPESALEAAVEEAGSGDEPLEVSPAAAKDAERGVLPVGWSSEVDPSTGGPMYVNEITRESVWEKPKEAAFSEI